MRRRLNGFATGAYRTRTSVPASLPGLVRKYGAERCKPPEHWLGCTIDSAGPARCARQPSIGM